MRRYSVLLLAISFLGLTGCKPNLVVKVGKANTEDDVAYVVVKNIGKGNAGPHLTYIELNAVGAADALKPQSQYIAKVNGIAAGESWTATIPFSKFSPPGGLDLAGSSVLDIVVTADAKDMVKESNEGDNIYDSSQ